MRAITTHVLAPLVDGHISAMATRAEYFGRFRQVIDLRGDTISQKISSLTDNIAVGGVIFKV